MHQERDYPGRVSGTDIVNPDFARIAQAYGMHGEIVTKTDEFSAAFERACANSKGGLLELVIDCEGISPGTTISELRARNS
jgi:acetolactate synthase-1/2/3 large subunit